MVNHLLAPYVLLMLRKDDKILLLKRSDSASFAPGHYSLVGGSVEKEETFRLALVREAHEEVGITINQDDLQFIHMFYRYGTEHELVACIFECRIWQGDPVNREPRKHSEMVWVAIDQLPEAMIPAHRGALQQIAKGVMYSEQVR